MLVSDGHTVSLANSGLDGVTMATAQPHDVIIMDVNMPDIDGIEATRRIRRAIAHGDQPRIVALTAYFADSDRTAMVAAGIDEVWTKPLKLEDMRALIYTPGTQSDAPHITPDTAAEPPDIVTDALNDLLSSVQVDRLKAFVDEFATDAQSLVDGPPAPSSVAGLDIADHLHKVAGSAAVLGAARAHNLLAAAEEAARRQDNRALDQALQDLAEILPVTLDRMTAILADTGAPTTRL